MAYRTNTLRKATGGELLIRTLLYKNNGRGDMEDKVAFCSITAKRQKSNKSTYVSLKKGHSNGIPHKQFEKATGGELLIRTLLYKNMGRGDMEDKVAFWSTRAKRQKSNKSTYVSLTKGHSNGIPHKHFEKSNGCGASNHLTLL